MITSLCWLILTCSIWTQRYLKTFYSGLSSCSAVLILAGQLKLRRWPHWRSGWPTSWTDWRAWSLNWSSKTTRLPRWSWTLRGEIRAKIWRLVSFRKRWGCWWIKLGTPHLPTNVPTDLSGLMTIQLLRLIDFSMTPCLTVPPTTYRQEVWTSPAEFSPWPPGLLVSGQSPRVWGSLVEGITTCICIKMAREFSSH